MSSPAIGFPTEPDPWRPAERLLRPLGLRATDLVNVRGGRSGFAWRASFGERPAVVRYSPSADAQAARMAAVAAARDAGVPAPRVLGHTADESGAVMVVEWLPGRPLGEPLSEDPAGAPAHARRFGALQRALHGVAAPPEVPAVPDAPEGVGEAAPTDVREALLHLDWHPYNVLVDADGAITGVIDWDNAARGDPGLDLARTRLMLTVDPSLGELPPAVRERLPAIAEAWAEGYGLGEDVIAERHWRWAAATMLAEWSDRRLAHPDALAPLRRIAFA